MTGHVGECFLHDAVDGHLDGDGEVGKVHGRFYRHARVLAVGAVAIRGGFPDFVGLFFLGKRATFRSSGFPLPVFAGMPHFVSVSAGIVAPANIRRVSWRGADACSLKPAWLRYAPTCTSTVDRGTGRMPRISNAFRAAVCSLSLMELPEPVATSFPSTETLEVKLGLWAGPCLEITR
jgi:hypothetical protein